MVDETLGYAARAEFDCQLVQKSHLDETIDNVGHTILTKVLSGTALLTLEAQDSDPVRLFRECVLFSLGLTPYLGRKLLKDPNYLSCFREPGIVAILHRPAPALTYWPPEAPKRLEFVLNSGHCPNQSVPGTGDMD